MAGHPICSTLAQTFRIAIDGEATSFFALSLPVMPRSVSTRPRDTKLRHRKGRFHFLGCGPQSEIKRRATPVVAVGPNPAAMRFDNRLTDCQAHAAALRLRRKECVEYLVDLVQGQPGPCVSNRNLDLAVLTQLRLHRKHAARILH